MAEANSSRRRVRTKQAAQYIGSTESTMEKWRVAGIGPPFIRLGSRIIVYDTQDLDSYMAGQRATSTSERPAAGAREKRHSRRRTEQRSALLGLQPSAKASAR
jgi:predicted DNA-binding transcriptional regulator AlpA